MSDEKKRACSDDGILRAKIDSALRLAEEKYKTTVIGFLDSRCRSLAMTQLTGGGLKNFSFYGGYGEAERVLLCIYPQYEEPEFLISWLRLEGDGYRALSHRDFLGSILALGISRECLGDILVSDEKNAFVAVFDRAHIPEYIAENIEKIGGSRVKVTVMPRGFEPEVSREFEELCFTVHSLRADSVLASLLHISRSDALELVGGEKLFVNSKIQDKPDRAFCEGDVISVRGYGKYLFDSTNGESRKGRIRVLFLKYK